MTTPILTETLTHMLSKHGQMRVNLSSPYFSYLQNGNDSTTAQGHHED